MQASSDCPVLLFSYGTLQDKAVQLASFGRELAGQAGGSAGFRLDCMGLRTRLIYRRQLCDRANAGAM